MPPRTGDRTLVELAVAALLTGIVMIALSRILIPLIVTQICALDAQDGQAQYGRGRPVGRAGTAAGVPGRHAVPH
jgi:hypothetical protein